MPITKQPSRFEARSLKYAPPAGQKAQQASQVLARANNAGLHEDTSCQLCMHERSAHVTGCAAAREGQGVWYSQRNTALGDVCENSLGSWQQPAAAAQPTLYAGSPAAAASQHHEFVQKHTGGHPELGTEREVHQCDHQAQRRALVLSEHIL